MVELRGDRWLFAPDFNRGSAAESVASRQRPADHHRHATPRSRGRFRRTRRFDADARSVGGKRYSVQTYLLARADDACRPHVDPDRPDTAAYRRAHQHADAARFIDRHPGHSPQGRRLPHRSFCRRVRPRRSLRTRARIRRLRRPRSACPVRVVPCRGAQRGGSCQTRR